MKIIENKLEKVIVYYNGAQLTRRITCEMEAGENKFHILDLPNDLNPDSFKWSIESGTKLKTLVYRVDEKYVSKEVQELLDEYTDIQTKIYKNNGEIETMNRLISTLSTSIEGVEASVNGLQERWAFVRKEMSDLRNGQIEIALENQKLESKVSELQNDINEKRMQFNTNGVITVEVTADKANQYTFYFTYYTASPNWHMEYVLEVEDFHTPAHFRVCGVIYQKTGEDWKDVELVLSSNTPSFHNQQPKLSPWYISYKQINEAMPLKYEEAIYMKEIRDERSMSNVVVNNSALTGIEYTLPRTTTVASSDNIEQVDIKDYVFPTDYFYHSVSKYGKDIYRVARLKECSELDIIAGNVDVFVENAYVGKTYLETSVNNKELEISLGRDRSIFVERIENGNYTNKTVLVD